MKTQFIIYSLGIALTLTLSARAAEQLPVVTGAGKPNEPLGGQPPAGSKPSVTDWDYQIKYQHAFEAVLWLAAPGLA